MQINEIFSFLLLLWAVANTSGISDDVGSAKLDDYTTGGKQMPIKALPPLCAEQLYYPCECREGENGIEVYCPWVRTETIKNVFTSVNDSEIYDLSLALSSEYHEELGIRLVSIPQNFLGNTRVTRISLSCDTLNTIYLYIDPSAFSSSQKISLTNISIGHFYMDIQPDFEFLNGFDSLVGIYLYNLVSLYNSFQYLPPLPSLLALGISFCYGMGGWRFPDLSPAKLKHLSIYYNYIDDNTADGILTSLAASTSADSLEILHLYYNELKRIPNQLNRFPQLKNVDLSDNYISHIPSSSLTFVHPLERLDLRYNDVIEIESGAFQGNFTTARVYLYRNLLTLFEEDVFKELLEEMMMSDHLQYGFGYLNVDNNPLDCGCDIAWLIRDHRNLLPAIKSGTCRNGIRFENLDPESFANCSSIAKK